MLFTHTRELITMLVINTFRASQNRSEIGQVKRENPAMDATSNLCNIDVRCGISRNFRNFRLLLLAWSAYDLVLAEFDSLILCVSHSKTAKEFAFNKPENSLFDHHQFQLML